jgi:hypothetical protein
MRKTLKEGKKEGKNEGEKGKRREGRDGGRKNTVIFILYVLIKSHILQGGLPVSPAAFPSQENKTSCKALATTASPWADPKGEAW